MNPLLGKPYLLRKITVKKIKMSSAAILFGPSRVNIKLKHFVNTDEAAAAHDEVDARGSAIALT